MTPRPLNVPLEFILCPRCLAVHRAQRTWMETRKNVIVCPVHGSIFTAQELEQ